MRLFGSNSSAEKPNLHVVGYGGTIMSVPEDDLIVPKRESIDELRNALPRGMVKKFAKFETDVSEPFIDSANANVEDIMNIVSDIRERLSREDVERMVVLYGSDSMPFLMASLGMGISKKELNGKSLVVTCSMNHVRIPESDANTNFQRSVSLSLDKQIKGKIGLLFDKRFFPPFGLEKQQISPTFAFASRFKRISKFERNEWNFDRGNQKFDDVRGDPSNKFLLVDNVQTYPVTPMSDYSRIESQIRDNRATILVGLGDGNLRSDDESVEYLKQAALNAKGPVIVVGGAVYNDEAGIEFPKSRKTPKYAGNGQHVPALISGGAMTATEATVLVSNAIAKAEQGKGRSLTKEEAEEIVRSSIIVYPFRELKSSKVNPNAK